jgi:hypothetical protein
MLALHHQRLLANNLQPRGPSDPFRMFPQSDNFTDIMSWDCERELGFLCLLNDTSQCICPRTQKELGRNLQLVMLSSGIGISRDIKLRSGSYCIEDKVESRNENIQCHVQKHWCLSEMLMPEKISVFDAASVPEALDRVAGTAELQRSSQPQLHPPTLKLRIPPSHKVHHGELQMLSRSFKCSESPKLTPLRLR